MEVYKRQRYPAFRFYTNYSLYGQDPNQYFSALGDVKQSSLTLGVSATCTIFDGFKNKAAREKASLEIEKLRLEKEKKITQLKMEYEQTYSAYDTYIEELSIKKGLLSNVEQKLNGLERMFDSGLIQHNELLTAEAELLNQEYDLQKNIVNITSKLKEIEIMTGKNNNANSTYSI